MPDGEKMCQDLLEECSGHVKQLEKAKKRLRMAIKARESDTSRQLLVARVQMAQRMVDDTTTRYKAAQENLISLHGARQDAKLLRSMAALVDAPGGVSADALKVDRDKVFTATETADEVRTSLRFLGASVRPAVPSSGMGAKAALDAEQRRIEEEVMAERRSSKGKGKGKDKDKGKGRASRRGVKPEPADADAEVEWPSVEGAGRPVTGPAPAGAF
jgi:hypothetical protein